MTLTCEVHGAFWQTSSVRWFFNDTLLPRNQSVEHKVEHEHDLMITVLVLHIQNVFKQDGGLYKCFMIDHRGSAWNNVTLIVDEKGIP